MTPQDFTALLLNLDRDTARLAHMQAQLTGAHVVFTRQSGILGDAVPEELRGYFYHANGAPRTTMKRGEIGCYASHLRALKRAASGECGELVLIMEDDLEISPKLLDIVAEARRQLPIGWDILRLSNPPRRAYAPVARLRETATDGARFLVRYSKIPNSAGAYLVTRAGARKFLERGVRGLTFDDDLRRPWFHGMETFGIVPPPIQAGATKLSSIDAVEAGRFDKGISSRMERILRGDHLHMLRRATYNGRNLGPANWLACMAINLVVILADNDTGETIIHRAAHLFPAGREHA
jgi:glycosyl transferase family 25